MGRTNLNAPDNRADQPRYDLITPGFRCNRIFLGQDAMYDDILFKVVGWTYWDDGRLNSILVKPLYQPEIDTYHIQQSEAVYPKSETVAVCVGALILIMPGTGERYRVENVQQGDVR